MMNGNGWDMNSGMNWGMWLIPLLIILAIYFFMKNNTRSRDGQAAESPLDILKKRYAKGEVTKAQFEQMKKDI